MKKFISVFCVLFVLLTIALIPVDAAKVYQTYTYSIEGKALYSPDAYSPVKSVDYTNMGLDVALKGASDLVVDKDNNIYIADTDNNRVVCLDRYFHVRFVIDTFYNDQKVADKFTKPRGVFVTQDRYEGGKLRYPGRIFVCDTEASRIVTFDLQGNFYSIIEKPESELFDENAVYWPVAVAVDSYDRLFVVSSETLEGIIVMTDRGEFTSFIGAQQSATTVWQQIWRRFQSKEQRKKSETIISYPYNNIDITENGFIYATIYHEKLVSKMESAIKAKSISGMYAPCKLLNPSGDEIMRRNGFWPPAGEIDFKNTVNTTRTGVSRVIDVACGPEQTWTIVDKNRSKVYTYDYDGNLLFAFGDSGTQLGNMTEISAICYQGDDLIVMDTSNSTQRLTIFKRTEYGDVLVEALAHQNRREYSQAIDSYKEILMRNSNYDAAYVGIGQALFRSAKYEEALTYYKSAYDTTNYSTAYKELRKEWMSKFFLLIPVIVLVLCVLIAKGLRAAAKVNKRVAVSGEKHTFWKEVCYVFHVIFHPMDGFWDLKHEKRGSVRASFFFIALTILALFYRSVGAGYIMNPQENYTTIFLQILVVFVPLLLFAIANWCITTLFDGEGNFKDIFIACSYSLLPIVLTCIPATFLSNYAVTSEVDILKLIMTLGFIWTGLLLFFGTMVTHDYTMSKNFGTTIVTVVGMAFIMFLGILFASLVMDMVTFVTNIVSEINYRL